MKRLVFIDDNQDFLEFIEEELADTEIEVVTIRDQMDKDVFEEIVRSGADLLFIDIYIVSMDVRDLVALIKKDSRTAQIPLYLLSFLEKSDVDVMAVKVGAQGAFSKPLAKEHVEKLIAKHFPV